VKKVLFEYFMLKWIIFKLFFFFSQMFVEEANHNFEIVEIEDIQKLYSLTLAKLHLAPQFPELESSGKMNSGRGFLLASFFTIFIFILFFFR